MQRDNLLLTCDNQILYSDMICYTRSGHLLQCLMVTEADDVSKGLQLYCDVSQEKVPSLDINTLGHQGAFAEQQAVSPASQGSPQIEAYFPEGGSPVDGAEIPQEEEWQIQGSNKAKGRKKTVLKGALRPIGPCDLQKTGDASNVRVVKRRQSSKSSQNICVSAYSAASVA